MKIIVFSCIKTCSTQLPFSYNLSNSSMAWDNIKYQEMASSCTDLDMSFNNLGGVIPNGAFNLFKLLNQLDLRNNKLTDIQKYSFYYHVSINSSFTDDNRLSWRPLRLRTLNLAYNDFKVLSGKWLKGIIATLRYLDISHNNIFSISKNSFHRSYFNLFRLKLTNNRLNCRRIKWMRNLSYDQINVTCFDYNSVLRRTVVNVPISRNYSSIQSNSHKYLHDLSVKSISIQELASEDYYFQTESSNDMFNLSCVYAGDNKPVIIWFQGERSVKHSIGSNFSTKEKIIKNKNEIISSLTGWTQNFDINFTCIFLKATTTNELNRISFNIQKREGIYKSLKMLNNDKSFFMKHASIFFVIILLILFVFTVVLCASIVVIYYILNKYKTILFLTDI